ncbi:histidine kinase [Streptomyces sp. MT29]|nr:histidine kinase [Streptomyces sp. MT29]
MMTFDRLAARVRALPPLVADLAVVAVVGLFTASDVAVNDPGYRQDDALTWALLAVSLVALVFRRRRPVPVACVTGAACAGWALHGHIGELLNLPVIVALYTVAVLGDRGRTLWTGLVAATASGVVALIVGRDVVNPQGLPVLEMVWPLVPLLLGEVVRTRRELLAEYAARAERAEEEREREAALRVRRERARVAREIHDILAHTVSAMTVQAGVRSTRWTPRRRCRAAR